MLPIRPVAGQDSFPGFLMTLLRNNLDKHKNVINTFYMTFNMKVPALKNNIDDVKPIFKAGTKCPQKVSTKYGANSLGEMGRDT